MIRARALLLLAPAALSGCIGVGFDLENLPGEPVAFVYRTRDESERRVELLQRAKESDLQRENTDRYDSSSFRLEAAAELVGLGRSKEQKAADLLGRMSMLDARTETVTPSTSRSAATGRSTGATTRSASSSRACARRACRSTSGTATPIR